MVPFIIFEVQTDSGGKTASLPPVVKTDENEALSEFYLKCGYAAISSTYLHTVFLLTADGRKIDSKSFMHGDTPEVAE